MRARGLPILDQVIDDGESVVLVGNSVVRLSALATALLAEMPELDRLPRAHQFDGPAVRATAARH